MNRNPDQFDIIKFRRGTGTDIRSSAACLRGPANDRRRHQHSAETPGNGYEFDEINGKKQSGESSSMTTLHVETGNGETAKPRPNIRPHRRLKGTTTKHACARTLSNKNNAPQLRWDSWFKTF